MAEPRLVILDEPMGGVNPVLGERMAAAVLGFVSAGTSVVIVEHNLPFIERVTDVVVVMAEGRVIAEAPFEQPQPPFDPRRHATNSIQAYRPVKPIDLPTVSRPSASRTAPGRPARCHPP